MIKIFDADEKDFSTNGNIAIEPLKCVETKKKSLNGWFIDVEVPIKFKNYIKQDKLCVIKSKSKINPQAFNINNISYTENKIIFQANHIAFTACDYFLLDCRPTNLSANNALNYINDRTDNPSPFRIVSDVETISTAYFVRKNLLEAWQIIEERWIGSFDFDNYTIYFKQKVGNDNGEIVSYKKNLQNLKIYEDWSSVVTKLYPVGYNGLMLPEKFLQSKISYDKYYTKSVEFETNLEYDDQTEENLLNELRTNANNYLNENQYPKVSYEIISNVIQDVEIGDIIYVKHPLVEIKTEVQEFEYNILTKKIEKLIFGNYNRDVKFKFDSIKNKIDSSFSKISKQDQIIFEQTKILNNLNKNGYVYIDDNEILILDSLPKEKAQNVVKFGLGGMGISENGIEGPFKTAITGAGINADYISVGTVKASRIEGYENLVSTVGQINVDLNNNYLTADEVTAKIDTNNADISHIKQQMSEISQTVSNYDIRFSTMAGKITEMSYNFNTDRLQIAKSDDPTNSTFDNKGVKIFNYSTLAAIFTDKGTGIDKLIVTGTAQLGYLKFVKNYKNNKKCTTIHVLDKLIEDLTDLESD